MAEQRAPDPRQPDEALADFTDQLLAGQAVEPIGMSSDPELRDMQKLVMRLNRSFGPGAPIRPLADRIWANLVAQWRARRQPAAPEGRRPWLRRAFGGRRSVWLLGAVVVAVAIAVLLLPSLPSAPGALPGAGGGAGSFLALVLAGLALAGVLWWLLRDRRR